MKFRMNNVEHGNIPLASHLSFVQVYGLEVRNIRILCVMYHMLM